MSHVVYAWEVVLVWVEHESKQSSLPECNMIPDTVCVLWDYMGSLCFVVVSCFVLRFIMGAERFIQAAAEFLRLLRLYFP